MRPVAHHGATDLPLVELAPGFCAVLFLFECDVARSPQRAIREQMQAGEQF